jgi:exodeoxyribonuclease V
MFLDSKYLKYLDGLTDGQNVAFHMIIEWLFEYYKLDIERRRDKQVFVLSGFAGTGKSYLMGVIDKFLRDYYNNDLVVQACAYTGKASTVLSEKKMNSTTIHHFLYIPFVKTDEKTNIRKVLWKRREYADSSIKLIIVDEASMMPAKLFEDLKLFNLPILCVGDGFQLPSIDMGTKLLENPDYTLTEITRQALDNSIIRLSMLVRNGGEIPLGDYGDNVRVVSKRNLYAKDYIEIIDKYDQLLVGTNKSRLYYNTLYRQYLLGEHYESNSLPCVGERIIVTQNNWDFEIDEEGEFNLFNGLIGVVKEVDSTNLKELEKMKLEIDFGKKTFITDWFVYDSGIFREALDNTSRNHYFINGETFIEDLEGRYTIKKEKVDYNQLTPFQKKAYIFSKFNNSTEEGYRINQVDFAYAISVHKFQGSEADDICVIDESFVFDKEDTDYKNRWLYTAITRAKKFLLLIK